ncbi:MAG: ribosome-associated translation inhibitor RaiA [Rhodocyclaceae bacterium]|nr:ribosome-associated translation inhibitor RaiA [Rhodocyclaceae bacterium]
MQVRIQAHDFDLTPALRSHVTQRVRFALTRYRDHVRRIEVRLSDENGPRGGVDKRCRLHLRVGGLPDIVIDDTEADLYAAVTRSAERAERALGRQIRRSRTLPSQRMREWPTEAEAHA